ncbi:MAG: helix-turn-helix transcriptional regulator [Parvibaculaceae bacterium]
MLGNMRTRTSLFGIAELAGATKVVVEDVVGVALYIVESGSVLFKPDDGGQTQQLEAGDVLLIPTGQSHEISTAASTDRVLGITEALRARTTISHKITIGEGRPAARLWASLSSWEFDSDHLAKRLFPDFVILRRAPTTNTQELLQLRSMLTPYTVSSDPVLPALANLVINAMIVIVLSQSRTPDKLDEGAIMSRALFIIHNASLVVTTAKDLASRMGLPPRQLTSLFLKHVGSTTAQYIHAKRLERARELLSKAPDIPLDDVCDAVHLASKPSFVSAFKKRYGQTPGQFAQSVSANAAK